MPSAVRSWLCSSLSAIAEMFLQSHERTADGKVVLRLLPALPAAWRSGEAKGLRARGGYAVDMTWEDGRLTSLRVGGGDTTGYVIKLNGDSIQQTQRGQSPTIQ